MKATLLVDQRVPVDEESFQELVLWLLAGTVAKSTHEFKYRLAYIVRGECVIRYDNERGKGDHRHFGTRESSYEFSSIEELLADFAADVARWNRENRRP